MAPPNGENQKSEETENLPEVTKVSIKIPPFWADKPELWFYQIEAQFNLNGIIREDTKFNYLISQLEAKFMENIWDIIKCTEPNKYSLAKERLLQLFKESDNQQIRRLLTGLELGDLKPSQLLRKMQGLAGGDMTDKMLKTLWLEKLPESIKNVVIISEETLEKVAAMADKIAEVTPQASVYSVGQDSILDELLKKVANLEIQICSLNYRNRSRSSSRESSHSRRRFSSRENFCYFHQRFGNKCRPEKCKQPCAWQQRSENSHKQQ